MTAITPNTFLIVHLRRLVNYLDAVFWTGHGTYSATYALVFVRDWFFCESIANEVQNKFWYRHAAFLHCWLEFQVLEMFQANTSNFNILNLAGADFSIYCIADCWDCFRVQLYHIAGNNVQCHRVYAGNE